jgi:NADH dehydrogenase FAD-containing subunit
MEEAGGMAEHTVVILGGGTGGLVTAGGAEHLRTRAGMTSRHAVLTATRPAVRPLP